jgi:ABC-type Fe3+-hydroxamate transport system substrate-binding protein
LTIIAGKELFLSIMPENIDQLGNTIRLNNIPKRVISLVPSQSEFLWHLGLRDEFVGITKFCIHPDELYRTKERVGGTKDLDLEKIRALKPDLIIGNKEENDQDQIRTLQKEFPVWMSVIYTLEDSFQMMLSLGLILNKEKESEQLVENLKVSLSRIKNTFHNQRVLYFIWNNPYMGAASQTFIDHVLNYLGFENTIKQLMRYPVLNESALKVLNPDFCFLSSEPFPFKEKHVNELKNILPNTKVIVVDGEVFSWYGTRLLNLEAYVKKLRKEIK